MSQVKLRHLPVELRAEKDAPAGVLRGYITTFDSPYNIGGNLFEEIARAAFDASLAQRDNVIPIFYQHDWDNPIGYATVRSDAHGAMVEVQLFIDANERARSVWLAAAAGALREWSVGFYPKVIETREDDGKIIERIIEGDLAEASVVVRGANADTSMLEVRARESLRAKIETAQKRDADADEDPGAVAQAIDAIVDLMADEAGEDGIDAESLTALLTALDVLVDRLLELLGVGDPGEETDADDSPSWIYNSIADEHARELLRELHNRV